MRPLIFIQVEATEGTFGVAFYKTRKVYAFSYDLREFPVSCIRELIETNLVAPVTIRAASF